MSPIVLINIAIIVVGLIFLGVVLRSKKSSTSQEDGEQSMVGEEGPKSKPTKHQQRYYFEFRFLPEVINVVERNQLQPAALYLYTTSWLRSVVEDCIKGFEFDWEDFETDIIKLDNVGNKELILYKFPTPEQIPEAILGAIVFDNKLGKGSYYTLELSYNGKWILGSTMIDQDGNKSHYNYGNLENPTVDSFINWVKKRSEN